MSASPATHTFKVHGVHAYKGDGKSAILSNPVDVGAHAVGSHYTSVACSVVQGALGAQRADLTSERRALNNAIRKLAASPKAGGTLSALTVLISKAGDTQIKSVAVAIQRKASASAAAAGRASGDFRDLVKEYEVRGELQDKEYPVNGSPKKAPAKKPAAKKPAAKKAGARK